MAIKAALLAHSKKAENILIYDISSNSSLFYYAVIVTASSLPQIRAIAEETVSHFKKLGLYSQYRDGSNSAKWRALDYYGFIVHILDPEARELYALDKLYHDCKKIDWKEVKEESKISKATKKQKKKSSAKKPESIRKRIARKRKSS